MDRRSTLDRGLRSVTRGTLVVFVASLVFIAVSFLWRVVLVRTLSPESWSVFALGLAYVGLFATVGRLGLGNTLARNLPHAKSDTERRGIVRVAILLGIGGGFLASLSLYLTARPLGEYLGVPKLTLTLEWFAASIFFVAVSTLLASIFQGYEDVGPNAYFIQILNPTLFLAFVGFEAYLPFVPLSLDSVMEGYVLAAALTLILVGIYTWRRLPHRLPKGPRQRDTLTPTVALALPFLVVATAFYLSGWGDTLVLGAYYVPQVGAYAASVAMARLLTMGITALSFIYLPVASRYHRDLDFESIGRLYVTASKWILLASLPFFLLFVFLPGPSLRLVYGPAYGSVVVPLQILAAGAFVSTLMGPSIAAQMAFAHKWLLLINAVVAAMVDVGVSLWLVPGHGATGAALAWASAIVLYPGLSLLELAAFYRVHPFRRNFWFPLVTTATPLGLLFLVLPRTLADWTLPVLGVGTLLWFVAMVIITKSIDDGDHSLLDIIEAMLGTRLNLVRRIGALGTRVGGHRLTGSGDR